MMALSLSVFIDVKFRTNEITSNVNAWKNGMDNWKQIYEIPELRQVLNGKQIFFQKLIFTESTSEVLDNVAHEFVKNISSSDKKVSTKDEDNGGPDVEQDDEDLYYYNKETKNYRIFNPVNKSWETQEDRPLEA